MTLDTAEQKSVLLQLVDAAARQGVPDAKPESVGQVVMLGRLRIALEGATVAPVESAGPVTVAAGEPAASA